MKKAQTQVQTQDTEAAKEAILYVFRALLSYKDGNLEGALTDKVAQKILERMASLYNYHYYERPFLRELILSLFASMELYRDEEGWLCVRFKLDEALVQELSPIPDWNSSLSIDYDGVFSFLKSHTVVWKEELWEKIGAYGRDVSPVRFPAQLLDEEMAEDKIKLIAAHYVAMLYLAQPKLVLLEAGKTREEFLLVHYMLNMFKWTDNHFVTTWWLSSEDISKGGAPFWP